MKYITPALLLSITLVLISGVAAAQEAKPSPTPEDTVRITTSLIQLDVVARLDKATSRPALTREVRIYKEGKLIATLSAVPIELGDGVNGRIVSRGTVRLSQGVEPGEYQLQVIVRDTVANRVAQQSLDFEVLP